MKKLIITIFCSFLLSGCGAGYKRDGAPTHYKNVDRIPDAKPKYLPRSRYGNPKSYVIRGKRYYVLKSFKNYNKTGIASWYGTMFHGRLTSSREPYDLYKMTAASKELPIPCYARVTNLSNGRSVIVKVNDRGPFVDNRIIDLSYAAAKKLGYSHKGTALVRVSTIDPRQWGKRKVSKHIQTVNASHKPKLYLQVGAYSEKNNATHMQQQIASLIQKPVIIVSKTDQQHTLYKVQIGPIASVTESDQLNHVMNDNGFDRAVSVVK